MGTPSRLSAAREAWIGAHVAYSETEAFRFYEGPIDFAAQEAVYVRMQELWATEFPTLDLTQAAPQALAWGRINGIRFDNMGLLHYELLTKTPGE